MKQRNRPRVSVKLWRELKGEKMNAALRDEVETLYHRLNEAWNNREAAGMAELFTVQGVQIGFDGSK